MTKTQTLKEIFRKGELKFYIQEGALLPENYEETKADWLRTKKYIKKWLEQKRQELQEPEHNPENCQQSYILKGREIQIDEFLEDLKQ